MTLKHLPTDLVTTLVEKTPPAIAAIAKKQIGVLVDWKRKDMFELKWDFVYQVKKKEKPMPPAIRETLCLDTQEFFTSIAESFGKRYYCKVHRDEKGTICMMDHKIYEGEKV